METYPLDIDANQAVRWLLEEQRRGTLRLNVLATRSYVLEELKQAESQSLGEEEAEDLSDVLAIGVLEVSPPAANDGWLLRLRVEDRIGRQSLDDEDVPPPEDEIDLEAFQAEFILPERGVADVSLEAENPQAKARFTRLFKDMLRDKHSAAAGG